MAHTLVVIGSGETFVVRADPWNRQTIPWLEFIQRVFARDHSWVIRVRGTVDDPFGRIVHEERVARRSQVDAVVARIERDIHDGRIPSGG